MAKWIARLRLIVAAGLVLTISAVASPILADGAQRNVLILASEDSLLPSTRILTDNIVAPLRAAIPTNLTIFSEFMDVSRSNADDATSGTLRRLSARFAESKIDLAIALGPQALDLLLRHREQLQAGLPVIFVAIRNDNPLIANPPAGVGGITVDLRFTETLNMAASLQPGLRKIYLVTGNSPFDLAWRERAIKDLAAYGRQISVVDLAGLPFDRVMEIVSEAEPDSAIIYLSLFKDGVGNLFVPAELTPHLAAAAKVPVYGLYPTFFGKGIVGGYISTFESAAAAAAKMALPLLRGESSVASLAILNPTAEPQVDWRVLQRWDLDADLLPIGTKMLFQRPSLWVEHWPAALTGLLVIVGQAIIILAFWRQKRQRRKAEASLRQANQHIEIAATTANLGLWSWCPARDSVWMTPRCRQMLGVAPNVDIDLGLFLRSLAGRKQDMAKATLLESLRTGGIFQGEFRLTEDGNKRWLSATGHCIRNEQGRLVAGTIIDVTERKKAQIESEQQREQLIHLTRVAVLGELSGALAHELNQPLTAILSNAQTAQRLIARPASDPVELQEILADIVQDDHRAGAVLSKLRTLIRKDDIHYAELDLNQIVDEVLNLVHSDLIERRIHVETDLSDGLPPARGDRVQIQQVLINLVRNACDAMAADPGQLHHLVLATGRHGNDGLAVTVADNGAGIPADLRDRLFEPFVTTKSQGLGLGLTISRSILSAHGGKIWSESNPQGGAIFGFSLPIVERSIERGMAWAS